MHAAETAREESEGDAMRRNKLIPQWELPNAFTLDLVPTLDGDRIAQERAAQERHDAEVAEAKRRQDDQQLRFA
jgi:hypothetical protein